MILLLKIALPFVLSVPQDYKFLESILQINLQIFSRKYKDGVRCCFDPLKAQSEDIAIRIFKEPIFLSHRILPSILVEHQIKVDAPISFHKEEKSNFQTIKKFFAKPAF